MAFIDDMRAAGHAVESTCRVLTEHGCKVAARTYRHLVQEDLEAGLLEGGPYPRILDTGCDYAAVGSVAARRAS